MKKQADILSTQPFNLSSPDVSAEQAAILELTDTEIATVHGGGLGGYFHALGVWECWGGCYGEWLGGYVWNNGTYVWY